MCSASAELCALCGLRKHGIVALCDHCQRGIVCALYCFYKRKKKVM